jgi:hypothetical protein
VQLALPHGAYHRLLGELRAAGVPAGSLRDHEAEWVARRAYSADPAGYAAAAWAGDGDARWIVRAAAVADQLGLVAPAVPQVDLVPSSVVVDPDAMAWEYDELVELAQRAGWEGRSIWFEGTDQGVNDRVWSQAERVGIGPGEVVVHLEGRDGVAYHEGRPVPVKVLADVLNAVLPRSLEFNRLVLLVCQAGRGRLRSLPAMLSLLGRREVRLVTSRHIVAVSEATGAAVALRVAYDADGTPHPVALSSFDETGQNSAQPTPQGATYPPGVDLAGDPGPFVQRMQPERGEEDAQATGSTMP